MTPRTIYCVLRTGGYGYTTPGGTKRKVEYGPLHVQRLQRHVRKVTNAEFCALSDVPIDGVNTLPLEHDWPGWWAKMELYRLPNVLYMDLDVAVTGRLDRFLTAPEFTVCGPMSTNAGKYNTSVMAWNEPPLDVYETFTADPEKWMSVKTKPWGDQDFLATQRKHIATWPEGWVMPYKQLTGDPDTDTAIVAFNGTPKPEQVVHRWLTP